MKYLFAILIAVCILAAPQVASAQVQPRGTIDLSASTFGFNPGDVYGPWFIQTFAFRTQAGRKDKPGATVTNRTDHDGGKISSSTAFGIDDYHNWSEKFFTYVSVGASSGNVLPRSQYYIEADPTIGDHLIFGAGYGVYNEPDGLTQHFLSIGPTVYFPHGNATVRYVPTWTTGQVSAPSYTANLSLGEEGKTVTSLTWQGGIAPQFVVNDPSVSNRFANKTSAMELVVRHWVNWRFGYHVGASFASQTDRLTGAKVYDSRGLTAGLFFGVGRLPPTP